MTVSERIEELKLVPVVVINREEDAEGVLGALVKGGLPVAEITFRTACAPYAIKLACEKFPEMLAGAGTVINAEQCEKAIECGAKFIVSPGLSEEVAAVCRKHDVPYYPGIVTPTEIMKAISLGLTVIKFFPSNVFGGIKAMKALSAPFPQVRFIPTGGIGKENIEEYLAWDKIYAVGGSSFTEEALLASESGAKKR